MFSLIITVISIILAGLLAAAAIYYVGDTSRRADEALADQALTQIKNIHSALELHNQDLKSFPASLAVLTSTGHLSSVPTLSPNFVYSETADVKWELVKAGGRAFWARESTREGVCRAINRITAGTDVIAEKADPKKIIQCYGSAEPFTVLFGVNPDVIQNELPPDEVCDPAVEICTVTEVDVTPEPPQQTTTSLRFMSDVFYGNLVYDIASFSQPGPSTFVSQGSLLGSVQSSADDSTVAYLETLVNSIGLSRSYTGPSDPVLLEDLSGIFGLTFSEARDTLLSAGLVSEGQIEYYEASVSNTDSLGTVTSSALARIAYKNEGTSPISLTSANLLNGGRSISSYTSGGQIVEDACSGTTLQPGGICSVSMQLFPASLSVPSTPYRLELTDSSNQKYATTLTGNLGGASFVFTDAAGNPYSNETFPPIVGHRGYIQDKSSLPQLPTLESGEEVAFDVYLKNIGLVADRAPAVNFSSPVGLGTYTTSDSASCESVSPGDLCRVTLHAYSIAYTAPALRDNPNPLITSSHGPRTIQGAASAIMSDGAGGSALFARANFVSTNSASSMTLFSQGSSFPTPSTYETPSAAKCGRPSINVQLNLSSDHSFVLSNPGNRDARLSLISMSPGLSSSDPRFFMSLALPSALTVPAGGTASLNVTQVGVLPDHTSTNTYSVATYDIQSVRLDGSTYSTGRRLSVGMTIGPSRPVYYEPIVESKVVQEDICVDYDLVTLKDDYWTRVVSEFQGWRSVSAGDVIGTAPAPIPVSTQAARLYYVPSQNRMELDVTVGLTTGRNPAGNEVIAVALATQVSGLPAGSVLLNNGCKNTTASTCTVTYAIPAMANGGTFSAKVDVNHQGLVPTTVESKTYQFNFASPSSTGSALLVQTVQ